MEIVYYCLQELLDTKVSESTPSNANISEDSLRIIGVTTSTVTSWGGRSRMVDSHKGVFGSKRQFGLLHTGIPKLTKS
jgi:hypothetical protein